jgi:hypothetical protein
MQQEAPGVWSQDCTQQGTYVVTGLGLTLDIKLLHPERQAPSHCLTTEGVQAVAAWVSHSVELSKPLSSVAAAERQTHNTELEQCCKPAAMSLKQLPMLQATTASLLASHDHTH